MSNLSEARNQIAHFAKVFKVFRDAENFLRNIEGIEDAEKMLSESIKSLTEQEQILIDKNQGISDLYAEAEKKAQSMLNSAEDAANRMKEKAMLDVAAQEDMVKAAKSDLQAVKDLISSAQSSLSDVNSEISKAKKDLENLNSAKDAARKALGV